MLKRTLGKESCMFHVIMRVLINCGLETDGDVTALWETVGVDMVCEGEREGGKRPCSRANTPPGCTGFALRLEAEDGTTLTVFASASLGVFSLHIDESRFATACMDWESMAHRHCSCKPVAR
jgi:hypothetical protein